MVSENSVRKTRYFDVTPRDIVDIAKMAQLNEQQRIRSTNKTRRHYDIDKADIEELVKTIQAKRKKLKPNTFKISQQVGHRRFGYNEYVYDVSIGPNNMTTLLEFLECLREVFNYLINIMRYIASAPTDKARFYISKAPQRGFSTAVLNVADFNAEMFFDAFEKHMQSNAQEVIDNGWQSTISMYIFPNKYVPRKLSEKKKKNTTSTGKLYKRLGKNVKEIGRGRKKKIATKHGREVRHGIFQIVGTNCFAFAFLVARSFIDKDDKYQILHTKPNTSLTTLYTDKQITDIYEQCHVPKGGVRVDQLYKFYEILLCPDGIDLVVFSKQQNDTIVYDSRLDAVGNLSRINVRVMYLWLNDSHYDVIISPNIFLKSRQLCFKCMTYFRYMETRTNHVCRTAYTCQSCYAPETVCGDEGLGNSAHFAGLYFETLRVIHDICSRKYLKWAKRVIDMRPLVTACSFVRPVIKRYRA
jgi:hypothetical protein